MSWVEIRRFNGGVIMYSVVSANVLLVALIQLGVFDGVYLNGKMNVLFGCCLLYVVQLKMYNVLCPERIRATNSFDSYKQLVKDNTPNDQSMAEYIDECNVRNSCTEVDNKDKVIYIVYVAERESFPNARSVIKWMLIVVAVLYSIVDLISLYEVAEYIIKRSMRQV